MAQRYACDTEEAREEAIEAAALAINQGSLVVIPTDTVYGIGADAFDPAAVRALLEAKGRGRDMPPPVLISSPATMDALAVGLDDVARLLMEEYWPGPLTIIARQQESLQWDLGDTRGTVAVRMPGDEVALAVLERTGPLAVSSANLTGRPAAVSAAEAQEMLGDHVEAILDAGDSTDDGVSTIVDVTVRPPRVLRVGEISPDQLDTTLAPLQTSVEVHDPDHVDPEGQGEEIVGPDA